MFARVLAGLAVVVLACGFAPAPKPKPKPKAQTALEQLEGTWEVENLSFGGPGGKPRLPANFAMTARIKDGKWSWERADGTGVSRTTITYSVKVDTSRKPAHIDMEGTSTALKGRQIKLQGIYEITADGKMKMSYSSSGTRPTGFDDMTNRSVIFTLKRTSTPKK